MTTATNESPFNPKHQEAPSFVNARPPSTGPITRARLNWIELSAIALGRSSGLTREGISAWLAGPPNAFAKPAAKERVRMCQTFTASKAIRPVKRKAQLIWMYCEPSRMCRRSIRSATTPPTSENRKIGISPRNASRPSRNGEPEICSTSQLWASFCIQVPTLEVHDPSQRSRKSRYRKALKTRPTKSCPRLWERRLAVDQVDEIAVGVREEHQPVSPDVYGLG